MFRITRRGAACTAMFAFAASASAAPVYTTTATVNYDPNAPTSNFSSATNANSETAYTVRTGSDADFFYVDVTAMPPAGATVDQFANIYIGGPSFSGIVIETTNDRAINTGSGGPYYSLANTGFTYSAITNDISFALPFSFLETDPLGMGFTKVNPGDLIRVSYSQSFGYSFVGGSTYYDPVNRLGAQIVPAAGGAGGVPEPASWALMVGGFGALGAAMRRRRPSVTYA